MITSRTDPLDAWYFEDHLRTRDGKKRLPTAPPKPRMASRSARWAHRTNHTLGDLDCPSIIATLLSGDIKTQRRMAPHARDVCAGTANGATERTITIPIPTLDDGGWVMVWGTCPKGSDRVRWELARRAYLRAKGHQLGVSRAAMFAFDGETGETIGVLYEQIPEELSATDAAVAALLQPASALRNTESVRTQIRGQRSQPHRKRRSRRR